MPKNIYVTITCLDLFGGHTNLRVGDELTLEKDLNNQFDDEAILVFDENDFKRGYVANSVRTVARGTYSSGRLYDLIKNEAKCIIRFILEDALICEIIKS